MSIADNLKKVLSQLPQQVELVAVSKFNPNEKILEAYHAGQRIFGENKVQEMTDKYETLPKDIKWHFIGHLQTNKVKYIVPFVELIHSVDSLKLLKEINKQAIKNERVVDCLLQIHIAQEETKFGFSIEECNEFLDSNSWREMHNIRLCGFMAMASNTDDRSQIEKEFHSLRELFDATKEKHFKYANFFKELSMGMSNDFDIAVNEGSTLVRIGSDIFGKRNY